MRAVFSPFMPIRMRLLELRLSQLQRPLYL